MIDDENRFDAPDDDYGFRNPEEMKDGAERFIDAVNNKFDQAGPEAATHPMAGPNEEGVTTLATERPHPDVDDHAGWQITLLRSLSGAAVPDDLPDWQKGTRAVLERPGDHTMPPTHYFVKDGVLWEVPIVRSPQLSKAPHSRSELVSAMRRNVMGAQVPTPARVDADALSMIVDSIHTSIMQ